MDAAEAARPGKSSPSPAAIQFFSFPNCCRVKDENLAKRSKIEISK